MPSDPRNPLDLKFVLLFVLAAYGSYLFHEFGHWSIGEILGNDMAYSLNYVSPRSGSYLDASHNLYSSIGGPAFSILQALIALLLIEKYKNLSIYPFAFFPMYSRFFSLAFGGFEKQDEARIAVLLDAGRYTVAIVVVVILLLIVVRCSSTLKLDLKKNGSIAVLATLCQLLVIGTYELFSRFAVFTG